MELFKPKEITETKFAKASRNVINRTGLTIKGNWLSNLIDFEAFETIDRQWVTKMS